ncbi:translocation/assembly module TamB [Belliella sp. R4-6]|uniref:Translocation/assembly module TamB n=1 Tax=Belliella alkalica TaxID=1730871 RepID=A0ABS9VCP3_9BACT|nr:translocation/assembly module TamB [Belliella alkalica]MCH7414211.1 translocation/assembly module TamB [Belliella alkalica]
MVILIALIFFIRSPWGQGIVVNKATSYLSQKTNSKIEIDRLFLTFGGNFSLEGLYVEDMQSDTLLYSKDLEVGVGLWSFISSGDLHISKLEWDGLKARVIRKENSEKFNYDFLIDAFVSDTTNVQDTEVSQSETESEPMKISIDPISLRNFDLIYLDENMGMDAKLLLGSLDVDIPFLDLEKLEFDIRNVEIKDSQISYKQTKPFSPSEVEESESEAMALVSLDNFLIQNVSLVYNDEVLNQLADVFIGDLHLEVPEFDLASQKVMVKELSLLKSKILFHDFSTPSVASNSSEQNEATPFEWPNWIVDVGLINLEENRIEFKTKDVEPRPGFFNPEAMIFDDLTLTLDNVYLKNEKAGLNISEFNFKESGGFELRTFTTGLKLDNKSIEIDDFRIETNRSKLRADLALGYNSIQALIESPDRSSLDIEVSQFLGDIRDAYFFEPSLRNDEMIKSLASYPVRMKVRARGDIASLDIPNLEVSWDETRLSSSGNVSNLLDMDLLAFDFPEISIKTDKKTILKFVDQQSLGGINLPESLALDAEVKGQVDDLKAQAFLETEMGKINFDGAFKNQEQIVFLANIKVDQLQLGNLLDNPGLDTLTFEIQSSGSGTSINDLNAELTSNFERLKINGNDYSGMVLEGQMENGIGDVKLALEDEYLNFELLTKLELDSINSKIDVNLDLKGADFYELGFFPQSLRGKFLFTAQFEGNPSSFDLQTNLKDAIMVYEQRSYPIGNLDLKAMIREDSTSLDIKSLLVNGKLRSNTSPQLLSDAIGEHLKRYLDEQDSSLLAEGDVMMNLNLTINQAPILNQVFLQGLEKLDTAKITVDFNQRESKLDANVDFPYLKYSGIELDSLGVRVRSDQEDLDLAFGFMKLVTGPLSMDRTYFTGELQDSRLYFDFNSFDGDERLVHVATDIGMKGDTLSVHISPEDLLLNKREWQIPENNEILLAENFIHFEEFRFFRNNQELRIKDDLDDVSEEHLAIEFKDFRLETFTSLLNPDELIAGGTLNGRLVVENPFGAIGLLANLKVAELKALDVPLGNLSLDAVSEKLGDYKLELALKDGGFDLDLGGSFIADEAGGEFDLDLDLNKIEMQVIADLAGSELRDASGFLSGKINASGTTTAPKYEGEFAFNQAAFLVSQLNSKYLLPDEKIRIDNEGVYLDNFTLQDSEGQKFVIDGSVKTESYINPSFDLKLKANSFKAVSSSREDNDLFFGSAILDADVTVLGDLNLPRVNANISIKEGTNFTVIIPETQLDIVERDGIVQFVNRQDPFDILTRQGDEVTGSFAGYDIRSVLKIDPDAVFKIIVDERSGDNLEVSGRADLNLQINPNGRMTLSGNYEITKGHYEMSLYNLVSRRFEIASGSRITWNGDPMDANLNISAIYTVRTAATELMASQLSGSNTESRTQFMQELPFSVYLNVDGELLRPEISFRLDMPEEQRGALGGNVYSRVLQVNEQEDELNKQVFSLLVLNRFFPSTGSDGSGGGTSAIARNSVSQVLSGQLNALSSSVFGNSGLELDFDLDSFTDYQGGSAQDRTQLNVSARKRLFDDRLIVQVGSQVDVEGSSQNPEQANAVLGNVSLEYILTKNERYRLRAFRKNQFESIIDGQLIITGIGVIFNREFNQFFELWRGVEADKGKTNPIDKLNEENGQKEKKKEEGETKEENSENIKKEEDEN